MHCQLHHIHPHLHVTIPAINLLNPFNIVSIAIWVHSHLGRRIPADTERRKLRRIPADAGPGVQNVVLSKDKCLRAAPADTGGYRRIRPQGSGG